MNPFKCDVCGRFISHRDLDTGKAIYRMLTPDSDISFETYEAICAQCNKKEKEDYR